MPSLYIGVDGGATKTKLRIEDDNGRLLGQAVGGPASIRYSVDQAWASIQATLLCALQPLGISLYDVQHRFHVGMGLAGCELAEACAAFRQREHPFETLVLASDAHTACLGAHGGQDGAIIIIGTGAVGYQLQAGRCTKVGGFGFPQDDEGSGAWLGLQAVSMTFKSLDGRQTTSDLTRTVYARFNTNLPSLTAWANAATAADFATLAPLVIAAAENGDAVAIRLLQQAAAAIDEIGAALSAASDSAVALPCSLIGSISPFLMPYLSASLRLRLGPCQLSPDAGAILLVKQRMRA